MCSSRGKNDPFYFPAFRFGTFDFRSLMSAQVFFFDDPLAYQEGLAIQHKLHAARVADEIPDTVLFLQHLPVITLGNRGREHFLQVSKEELSRQGIDVIRASRGGDITYHAPGQLIIYPIIKLGSHEADAHGYLYNLEEIAIRTANDFGVQAFRREGMNGAWSRAGKLAAIGFRLKKWVSLHGMSFNVNVDLAGFNVIIPCGLKGESVASLKSILGKDCPRVDEVRSSMSTHFEDVCGRKLKSDDPIVTKALGPLQPLPSERV